MTTADGKTYFYVSEQGGERHVSGIPLTEREAADTIQVEADLHRAAGWRVMHVHSDGKLPRIVCERNSVRRVVSVEENPHEMKDERRTR